MSNPHEQVYRVTVRTAVGTIIPHDVRTDSGDDAAAKALAQFPGAFVAHVEPAPQSAQDKPKAEAA